MHFTDLSNDVLLQITRLLSVESTFDLATTCKQMYERIRHLPLTGTFTLDHRKKVGDSFFLQALETLTWSSM